MHNLKLEECEDLKIDSDRGSIMIGIGIGIALGSHPYLDVQYIIDMASITANFIPSYDFLFSNI